MRRSIVIPTCQTKDFVEVDGGMKRKLCSVSGIGFCVMDGMFKVLLLIDW